MEKELLLTIEIPNYIRKIKLSDSRRAKYWIKDKVLSGKQKLPKKFLKKAFYSTDELIIIKNKKGEEEIYELNKDVCYWKKHQLSGKKFEFRLTDDKTDEYIIKNTKVAGTENWLVINSQDIYSGNMHPNVRSKVVKLIHDYIKSYILCNSNSINLSDSQNFTFSFLKITKYPIRVLMELHDYVNDEISKNKEWDVDNRCYIWGKCFMDVLTELKIIEDDNRLFVTQPPVPLFCPLNSPGLTPKLIFRIYADNRLNIKSI